MYYFIYTGLIFLLLFSSPAFLVTISVSQRVSGSVKGMNSFDGDTSLGFLIIFILTNAAGVIKY